MAAKFKEGKSYHVTHPDGVWEGIVRVLEVDRDGAPRILVTKYIKASDAVIDYFNCQGPRGVVLGRVNWSPKEININLENK